MLYELTRQCIIFNLRQKSSSPKNNIHFLLVDSLLSAGFKIFRSVYDEFYSVANNRFYTAINSEKNLKKSNVKKKYISTS